MKKQEILFIILIGAVAVGWLLLPRMQRAPRSQFDFGTAEFAYISDSSYTDSSHTTGQKVFTGITAYIPYGNLPIPSSVSMCYNWIGTVSGTVFFQIGTAQDSGGIKNLFWYVWDSSQANQVQAWTVTPDPDQTVNGRFFSMLYDGHGWALYVDGTKEYYVQNVGAVDFVDVRTEHYQNGQSLDLNTYTFKDVQVKTQYGWIPFLAVPSSISNTAFTSYIVGNFYANHYGTQLVSASSFRTGPNLNMNTYVSPYMATNQFSASPLYPTPATLPPLL